MVEHGLFIAMDFSERDRAAAVARRCREGGAHIASSWHDAPSLDGLSEDALWEAAHRARTEVAGARGLLAVESHDHDTRDRDLWMLVEMARLAGKYVLVRSTSQTPVLGHAPGLVIVTDDLAMWAWVEAFKTSWTK